MTTVTAERQKRLIHLMLDKIPQYIPKYRGKERVYVADFVRRLQNTLFSDLKGQQAFLSLCEEYVSKYYIPNPAYMDTPFLWFSIAFTRKCMELIRVDQSGKYFLRLITGILRDRTGDHGILPLLEQAVPLTDLQWEELQYQVRSPKFQPRLSAEELKVVHWVYETLSDLRITQLSRPYLQGLMRDHGFSGIVVKQFDMLVQKTDFVFWVNPNYLRLNLWMGFLIFELPLTRSLTDVIDFANPVNSVLRWSRIRKAYLTPPDTRETQKFMGVIYLPQGHETAFLTLLRDKQAKGEIYKFQLEPIEEYSLFSLPTYRPGEGFEQYNPQDYWPPLKAFFESTKEANGGRNYSSGTSLTDSFIFRHRPGASEPLTPALAGILKKIWGELPLRDTRVNFDPLEQILVDRLQQEEVLVLGFSMENIISQLGLSTFSSFHIRLPRIPWGQLLTLLRYSQDALIYQTPKAYHVISRWQDSLIQFLEPLLPWHKEITLSNVITAQRGRPDPRDLDPTEGVWRTPLILRDYI